MTHEMPHETIANTPQLADATDIPATETAGPGHTGEDIEDELPELEEDEAEQIIVLDDHGKLFVPLHITKKTFSAEDV